MSRQVIPLIEINAEVFKFDDIDNAKLVKEVSDIDKRYTYDPASVAFEDRVLERTKGSEVDKLLTKVIEIGDGYGLDLVHYHLLTHDHLESTNTHHHMNAQLGVVLSWVYYVSVPQDSGKLVFMYDQYDIGPTHVHQPTNGTLLMFPPFVLHKVTKNMSTEKRISIAGDFAVRRNT